MNGIQAAFVAALALFSAQSACAREQRYKRVYQKEAKVVQKTKVVKQDVQWRQADAYLSVSRGKPTVSVDAETAQTGFRSAAGKVECGGAQTFSCFRYSVGFKADVDCDRSALVLKAEQKQPPVVVVSSEFQKGTCLFDKIVKHELTHEKIFRSVLDSYVVSLSQKMIAVYEAGQRDDLSCKEIRQNIDGLVSAADGEHASLQSERGRRIDSPDGAHAYGFETCRGRK